MTFAAVATDRTRRATLELADVFREHVEDLGSLTPDQGRAIRAILKCRTSALGGHVRECDRCGHREVSYNSCRNRHCPKCLTLEAARWVESQKADLLPVPYFHLVFTVPRELHPFFRFHPKRAYDLLFKTVAESLQEVALNPKHLGARIGVLSVLHTWTQKLLFHPHIHCIVPGGGMNPEGERWISSRANFFLPVRVLSKVFRGKLLSEMERASSRGQFPLPYGDPKLMLHEAAQHDWVVYSKRPFSGPDTVLQYLARYTHRIAISNQRLLSMKEGQVTFFWRDRADGNNRKVLTLGAVEFLRRYLLHVLPRGLVRIRHYGFLANSVRKNALALCREWLKVPEDTRSESKTAWHELVERLTGIDPLQCPACQGGRMELVEEISRSPLVAWRLAGRGTSP